MEARRLNISKVASRKLYAQSQWYYEHRDASFVRTMLQHFESDVTTLRHTPTIGKKFSHSAKREYRAYVSNHKCIIIYRYTTRTLYITDLVFTDTHSTRLF